MGLVKYMSIYQTETQYFVILDNFPIQKEKQISLGSCLMHILHLFLPPYSPYLNPIETIWRILKRKLCRIDHNNLETLV
jgi:transposase